MLSLQVSFDLCSSACGLDAISLSVPHSEYTNLKTKVLGICLRKPQPSPISQPGHISRFVNFFHLVSDDSTASSTAFSYADIGLTDFYRIAVGENRHKNQGKKDRNNHHTGIGPDSGASGRGT